MNYIFGAVNYKTSFLIEKWASSIRKNCENPTIYIVDNFSTLEERLSVKAICEKNSIELILNDNEGYGAALNKLLEQTCALVKHNPAEHVYFLGNLDIEYKVIDDRLASGNVAYITYAFENERNRNPFLTTFQKKLLVLHQATLKLNSSYVLAIVVLILKLAKYVPSRLWAVHGSLFCFNALALKDVDIFNKNSFLYSEELEFASYVENNGTVFVQSDTEYLHIGHASTSGVVKKFDDFFKYWRPSFINWIERWDDRNLVQSRKSSAKR